MFHVLDWIRSSLVWMVFSGEWIGGFHWNGPVVLIGLDGFGFFNGASFTGSSEIWMLTYISKGSGVKRNRFTVTYFLCIGPVSGL
jgi:hypothetical protein